MTVAIIEEPPKTREIPAEDCCICGDPSRTWSETKDVAICRSCAENLEEDDVPTKDGWFEKWRESNQGFLPRQIRRNILT